MSGCGCGGADKAMDGFDESPRRKKRRRKGGGGNSPKQRAVRAAMAKASRSCKSEGSVRARRACVSRAFKSFYKG